MEEEISFSVERGVSPVRGIGCNDQLSYEEACQFYRDGYRFCLRSLYSDTELSIEGLDASELSNILRSGLSLMPVQHINENGISLGRSHGNRAAMDAYEMGIDKGVTLWCILANSSVDLSTNNVVEFCNSWYKAVNEQGYLPGLFVNDHIRLSSSQLAQDLDYRHFCRADPMAANIKGLGYELSMLPDIRSTLNSDDRIFSKFTFQLGQKCTGISWLIKK